MTPDITDKLKSTGERKIATALTQYGIPFTYEPKLAVQDGSRRRVFLPDFYLPTRNVYIEYFGRAGNDNYDRHSAEKMRLYQSNGHAVAALYPWDLCQKWPGGLLERIRDAEQAAVPTGTPYGNPATSYARHRQSRGYQHAGPRRYRR